MEIAEDLGLVAKILPGSPQYADYRIIHSTSLIDELQHRKFGVQNEFENGSYLTKDRSL
ncbi:hypothetical protein ACNR90_005155 [Candidozyma auris]